MGKVDIVGMQKLWSNLDFNILDYVHFIIAWDKYVNIFVHDLD